MAVQTTRVCDFDDATCQQPASGYSLWRDGDKQAHTIDLCDEHAQPLLSLMQYAHPTDLPTKPRERMAVTKLRTTDKTSHLKKR